jgi:biopolymer transport protein ExbB
MWEIVSAGGPFMWPIILCSVVAVAIVLERTWSLQRRRIVPPDLTRRVWALVEAGQVNERTLTALEANSPLGRILAMGLANRDRPREVMMDRLEDAGRHVAHDLDRFLNTLGTVAGIIKAFNAIYAGGMGDPQALSGGISEALVTTAAGLCVAIPSYIAYRYLRGRVESIVVQIEKDVLQFTDALDERGISSTLARAHLVKS